MGVHARGSGAGATWTQQAKLTGAGESGNAWFGQSVALSADGATALVGGYVDHSDTGAAWVFARTGSGAGATWAQQGAKLTGGEEESGEGEFGWSVALSGEGDTALIGGRKDDEDAGAAWVFARSGSARARPGRSRAQSSPAARKSRATASSARAWRSQPTATPR